MRPSRTTSRWITILLGTLACLAVAVPGVLADTVVRNDDTDDDTTEDAQEDSDEDADGDETGEDDSDDVELGEPQVEEQEPGDDEATTQNQVDQVAEPVDSVCTDVLLTATPDGTTGDSNAVAITSQLLETDVEGWTRVSWQAASDTELTAVTAHTQGGLYALLGNLQSGTVDNVQQLTFCGTTPDTSDDTPDGTPTEDTPPDPPADDGASNGGSADDADTPADDTSSGESDDDITVVTPPDEDDDPVDDEVDDEVDDDTADGTDPADGEAASDPAGQGAENGDDAADATTADDDAQDDATDDADTDTGTNEDGETEVLGVQLTDEDGQRGNQWLVPVLMILVLGALAAGLLALRAQRPGSSAGGRR